MISKINQFIPGPVQHIQNHMDHPNLFIKRLDLVQSWADGNKYYKLKDNIAYVLKNDIKMIVSKGGMFSNYLFSLAKACHIFGIKLICVVRGYAHDKDNPVMNEIIELSHDVLFLNPHEYNQFGETEAKEYAPDAFFIPEGGMNESAIHGAAEILEECMVQHPTHIIISGGTLTTACGLLAAAPESLKIIIVPAWKGCSNQYVEDMLQIFHITPRSSWELWPDYHFGGFAKYNRSLIEFMYSFTQKTQIPFDPVYTGKMMYGLNEKIKKGYFSKEDRIIAIHTGGIQGVKGFAYRYPEDWRDYAELIFK